MKPIEPLPLFHSWPIVESGRRFELGRTIDRGECDFGALTSSSTREQMARHSAGQWECDLSDGSLTWSDEVYDLFQLPRGTELSRAATVAQYQEGSRAAMERLRSHAIRHRRGFTLDAEIDTFSGTRRWMRLIAVPVCIENRVVRLSGLKHQITN